MHRCGGKTLLARHLGIERRLLRLGPAKDCHQLRLSRATLRGNTCTCLPQPVRRTMPQAGLVAPFPEAVSEALRRKLLSLRLIGDEEGHVTSLCSFEDRIQLQEWCITAGLPYIRKLQSIYDDHHDEFERQVDAAKK
jgi:hypothetical protein